MEQILVSCGAIRRAFVAANAAPCLALARHNVSKSLSCRNSFLNWFPPAQTQRVSAWDQFVRRARAPCRRDAIQVCEALRPRLDGRPGFRAGLRLAGQRWRDRAREARIGFPRIPPVRQWE